MTNWRLPVMTSRGAGGLAFGLALSMAALSWSGYRAVQEWQHGATRLAERRAQEAADFLVNALTRDMRAVQSSILSTQDWDEYMLEPPYEIQRLVAIAFARYPYPESFFAWRGGPAGGTTVFFNRADRRPTWIPVGTTTDLFPVLVSTDADIGRRLTARILRDAEQEHQFSTFDWRVGDVTYQVVARLKYSDPYRLTVSSVFGFVVNLDWVKQHYLQALASEIQRVRGDAISLQAQPSDESGDATTARADARYVTAARRPFPLLFFDPLSLAATSAADIRRETWVAQSTVTDDALHQASVGARRALLVTAVAGTGFAIGLVLVAGGIRANAELGRRRAEFVSSVTHELKTPVSTIRAAGETLLSGRLTGPDVSREYARLVVEQAKRLTRLLNNLLAYARITDTPESYLAEPVQLSELVRKALRDWQWHFENGEFTVEVDVPSTLPRVRVDRTGFELLLDNLIANAVTYAGERRWIRLSAERVAGTVRLEVADRGIGIPADELPHVTRRFFRGRRSNSGGSGLGLAIVERIVEEHGGSLSIESSDAGTTVRVDLPCEVSI